MANSKHDKSPPQLFDKKLWTEKSLAHVRRIAESRAFLPGADREGLGSEVIARLLQFEAEGNVIRNLHAVAWSMAKKVASGEKAKQRLKEQTGADIESLSDTRQESCDDRLTSLDEIWIDLETALDNLEESLRDTVVCHLIQQMSQKETAQALDIPIGTVKSRYSRALELLRNDPALEGYGSLLMEPE